MNHFDAIVVGSGAGGGAAAKVLSEAGKSVLLLEAGVPITAAEDPRDHKRTLGSPLFGAADAIPDTHGRRVISAAGAKLSFLSAVGGGTLVWGMAAWRFHPDDFRMASVYGVPEGSSLADWPISYHDLEPWYAKAEWEVGVAGNGTGHGAQSRPYPMPPLQPGALTAWLEAGARANGWTTMQPPVALNSQPRDGRQACIRCNECLGFTCPVDAKNGAANALVPKALATGLCELLTQAQATRITTDGAGRVTGVEFAQAAGGVIERQRAEAKIVILAGGAIETARLLLLSSSNVHPAGIGNHSDHVGRHLQGHTYPIVQGIVPPGVPPYDPGPGLSIATTRFNHGNHGIIGGAMLANDTVKSPLSFWRLGLPPEVPRWGRAGQDAMIDLYRRTTDVRAPVQEIPTPDNRIMLDPEQRDRHGLPLPRQTNVVHPETWKTTEFIRARLVEWLEACGSEKIWPGPLHPRAGADWFHQAGTCRMSRDPKDGVVDPSGRVHGHDNLFVADGSVHVTNGGFNPALTVFALAMRTAAGAAESL